jgi:hypothetical protein
MTNRSALYRAFLFGAFLAIAPVFDVLVGGTAGLLHFITTLSGIGLLAVSLSSGHPTITYERHDGS